MSERFNNARLVFSTGGPTCEKCGWPAQSCRCRERVPAEPAVPGPAGLVGLVVGVVVSQIDKISGERTAQNINFGIKLKEQMDALGIECTIRHADEKTSAAQETNDFFIKHLLRAK